MRKGEIACNKQFLLFPQCFLPCVLLIFNFKCTLKYPLQCVSILTSLKFCHLVMALVNQIDCFGFCKVRVCDSQWCVKNFVHMISHL